MIATTLKRGATERTIFHKIKCKNENIKIDCFLAIAPRNDERI